jgi:hypothetical protein
MTALPLHLGALHAYETVLLALIAFGPFVVLAFVVGVLRRRDLVEETELARPEGVNRRQGSAGPGSRT